MYVHQHMKQHEMQELLLQYQWGQYCMQHYYWALDNIAHTTYSILAMHVHYINYSIVKLAHTVVLLGGNGCTSLILNILLTML